MDFFTENLNGFTDSQLSNTLLAFAKKGGLQSNLIRGQGFAIALIYF